MNWWLWVCSVIVAFGYLGIWTVVIVRIYRARKRYERDNENASNYSLVPSGSIKYKICGDRQKDTEDCDNHRSLRYDRSRIIARRK